ncbi:methyl-accepting chemotaxis protein [Cohnella terricola]|uniref:Methyl-accepting chemotaxis protein n=1 Tax=Cohnella terricola TaxID=1289167 RepID=A0A559J9E9_9BACL|nr:methyl-accepting chemotaxis protein [Cohnella terricola]TVX96493.1 methyl-accepting chemotaxis protein [Cohnella terricola]
MKKKSGFSLTTKFIVSLAICLILVFAVMLQLTLNDMKKISISRGEAEAQLAGQQFGTEFERKLEGLKQELDMLGRELLQAAGGHSLSREDVIDLLKATLNAHSDILGTYTLWEPNAFDGKDAYYADRGSHGNKTGRFLTYIVRDGDNVVVETPDEYDTEGTGDYYLIPKKTGKVALLEPYDYKTGGRSVQMTSLVVPILDGNRFLGIVGVDFALDSLQRNASKHTPLGGYVAMISGKGDYVVNPAHPELISKPYEDSEEKKELFAKVKSGAVNQSYTKDESGDEVLRMFHTIRVDGSDDVMYTESVISRERILESYNQSRTTAQIVSLSAVLVLGVVLAFLTRRMIIRPVRSLAGSVNLMAEGDLTQRVDIRSKDEFGQLAGDFNRMTEELRGMFRLVSDLSMSVGATSEELTASAEQTSLASETIARSIEQVAAGSETQNRHTQETAQSLTEMAVGIQRIADSAEAVSASAQEVQEQTELGNARMNKAGEQMARLKRTVAEAELLMDRLGERSVEIGGIIGLISDISSQTNLLALNAAIEAAKAGEHGRGFAVVAAEVRKLADQTLQAAEEISTIVSSVQEETVRASDRMKQGASEIAISEQYMVECSDTFRAVATEMQQVNGQIQEMSAVSEEMNAGSEQVGASIEELSRLAQEASGNSQSVASASQEQLASMEEIASSAAALSGMVQELLQRLSRFKI